MKSNPAPKQKGFTLVELMLVVVILSIFAGMMTLSVGGSQARKNRAFYEHLQDSLSYIRLLSAESMQPMGLTLQTDQSGQIKPMIVRLDNAYQAYQSPHQDSPKNKMELSADISLGLSGMAKDQKKPQKTPTWIAVSGMDLPTLPPEVSLKVIPMAEKTPNPQTDRPLQKAFVGQNVPQIIWFGTGQATPARIEIWHQNRPIGDPLFILPDGSIHTEQSIKYHTK